MKQALKQFNKLTSLSPTELFTKQLSDIPAVHYDDLFKDKKPLATANSKLDRGIYSFSTVPYIACPIKCANCYDKKSFRYESVRVSRLANLAMALHHAEELEEMIISQVLSSKAIKMVRVHVGGDFFSASYLKMWERIATTIASKRPEVVFYTYTKTGHAKRLRAAGINTVKSKYGAKLNYGSLDYVERMAEEHKGTVCPVTKYETPDRYCGKGCKACMHCENVFFVQH